MGLLLALLPAAGHDQLWFLLMARRWLDGAQLYGPEIFDSNPPVIVWLSALAVLSGRLLHLPASAAGKLLVVFAETGASWLTLRFLRRSWRRENRSELLALIAGGILLFYVVPARDFGQREHILSFLLLPYVVASTATWPTEKMTGLRIIAGLLAGAAVCLKPHQALVPLAVETCLLVTPAHSAVTRIGARVRHLFRPEPVAILAVGLGFLGAVHRFAPLYFKVALPLTRETYWAIGNLSVRELVWQGIEMSLLGAVTVLLYVLTKQKSALIRILLVAASAAAAAYFLQGTGWYYQQLPAISFFVMALLLTSIDWASRRLWEIPRLAVPVTAGLCMLALTLTTYFTGSPFTRDRSFAIASPDPSLFTSLPAGTPVATLTTSVDEAMMPIERYGVTWAQRTNNLWLLPAILRSERPQSNEAPKKVWAKQRLAELDALEHRWMVEDLQRWRPEMVLVERCQSPETRCQELEDRQDNLLDWFLLDPAFRDVWGNYRYTETKGRFEVYMLRHQR